MRDWNPGNFAVVRRGFWGSAMIKRNERAEIEGLISEKEAARRIGVHVATVRSYRKAGSGPAYVQLLDHNSHSRGRYHPDDVIAWIKGKTRNSCRVRGYTE